MLSPVIYLMLHSLFFTLRLSGGGGSFPRPLKAAEEREYLERCAQGDLEARNVLVEHNLRLVAHIVKKYYAQTGDQDDLISIGTIGLIKGISTFKADKMSGWPPTPAGVLKTRFSCTSGPRRSCRGRYPSQRRWSRAGTGAPSR